jgi:tetratricopeptide (TPR) repeat protein
MMAPLLLLLLSASAGASDQQMDAPLPPGHPPVKPGAEPSSSRDLLRQLDSTPDLERRQKTFEVADAMGRLYYGNARYPEAVKYLTQAVQKLEPARKQWIAYQRRLHASSRLPSKEGVCPEEPGGPLDRRVESARQRLQANKPGGAACLRQALESAIETGERLANALFLTGDSARALVQYERVLEISPDRPDSLYGHASILFDAKGDDLSALRRAKSDWESYLKTNPTGSRALQAKALLGRVDEAIAARGVTRLGQRRAAERKQGSPASATVAGSEGAAGGRNAQPPPLSQEMIDAVQNTERTPELQEGLSKLVQDAEEHLARRRFQEALDAYKRVMPFQPENGRVRAGMAWALVGLERQPMADRIWSVAVNGDPGAVDHLGDALTAKGDKSGAKALWTKLASSAPAYADRSGLRGKLK